MVLSMFRKSTGSASKPFNIPDVRNFIPARHTCGI
jgi:hypothetical protein